MENKTIATAGKATAEIVNKLEKPCVLVWIEDLKIVQKLTNNIETYPGLGSYFQEFDTPEEMEIFITDNQLIE